VICEVKMNTNTQNIEIIINNERLLVSLKWLRGASRYNNGGTVHKNKYRLRVVFGRIKDMYR